MPGNNEPGEHLFTGCLLPGGVGAVNFVNHPAVVNAGSHTVQTEEERRSRSRGRKSNHRVRSRKHRRSHSRKRRRRSVARHREAKREGKRRSKSRNKERDRDRTHSTREKSENRAVAAAVAELPSTTPATTIAAEGAIVPFGTTPQLPEGVPDWLSDLFTPTPPLPQAQNQLMLAEAPLRPYVPYREVAVPQQLVARIIGKGGEVIMAICAATGADIKIRQETKALGYSLAVITGTSSAMEKAEEMVKQRLGLAGG